MSIVSNISTAFFSDCNTFATPTDPSYTKVVSFNKKIEQIYHPILPSSLLYRIAIKGSMELVYYNICFQFSLQKLDFSGYIILINPSGAIKTRLQLWSPNCPIGPATLSPFDRRDADWVFDSLRLVNINTQTGLIIWPQITIVQFWNPWKNLLERIAKENHFLNTKVVAREIQVKICSVAYW